MRNDDAQMMILEAIFFGITVSIALAFIFQISPTSIQTGAQSSTELKSLGDNALEVIYSQTMHIRPVSYVTDKTINPTDKLTVCIIKNEYQEMVDSLNEILPDTVVYNIYISNGTKTIFWRSSTNSANKITMIDPVSISYHPISIDPNFLYEDDHGFSEPIYEDTVEATDRSDIWDDFIDQAVPYLGSSYIIILELSYILP